MVEGKNILITIKFAEIDNKAYSLEQDGWVSAFVKLLKQTLGFYFPQPISFNLIKETQLISEQDFNKQDAIIYVLSPAFMLSSNIEADISLIEKASFFDTELINAKIHKVLKGPVKAGELPVTISMGRFYHFYQSGSSTDHLYDTLFEWDNSPHIRSKYWDSLTNLLLDLLRHFGHGKYNRFVPPSDQTVFLGDGGLEQLWTRIGLLGELNARGLNILPDHDHSIEVKHLKEPVMFYLRKSNLAIHFPEEFLPLHENSLRQLTELPELKQFIWFDPEAEKDLEKKKQYDELKQKLKNLDHVEAISSGMEELKEIIFSLASNQEKPDKRNSTDTKATLYLICSHYFEEEMKRQLISLLEGLNIKLLMSGTETGNEKRSRHYQYLKQADFSLICYNGKSPEWVRANINEVRKAAGLHAGTKNKQVRLAIITGTAAVAEEMLEFADTFPLIDAASPSFAEELNNYVNER